MGRRVGREELSMANRPLLAVLVASGVFAASRAPADGLACGKRLSAPVMARWTALGGPSGALGCPGDDESAGSTSPQGSKASEADFAGGMILAQTDGPRAGQVFVVTGGLWRLYFQFGGPSGWLGLPTADVDNFPDGERQSFEGGRITCLRATQTCEAEHADEVASGPAAPEMATTSPLDAWYDPARGDHLSIAAAAVAKTATGAAYQRIGPQAKVLEGHVTGSAPLKLFWNEAKGDHVVTATDDGAREAFADGYTFEASEGYVWTDPHPGAVSLEQWRDPSSGHHWLVVGAEEKAKAQAAGYQFVRIEGYAPGP
jgi:uncharacterized protein with LGFP repeats